MPEAQALGSLDLNHPGVMHNDFNRSELERANLVPDKIKPVQCLIAQTVLYSNVTHRLNLYSSGRILTSNKTNSSTAL
jgi:hypothetical protein